MSIVIKVYKVYNGCFFKFGVEVGVELSIVNALYIQVTDQGSAVQILHFYTSGAISIDSPTPTSTPNLKKHPLYLDNVIKKKTNQSRRCKLLVMS
jgi:hypothetical protein